VSKAAKRPRSEPQASGGGPPRELAAKRPRSEPQASEGGPPQIPSREEGSRLRAALELLAELERSAAPADVAFAAFHRRARRLPGAGQRAVQERVQSWLRRRAALDWWIQRAGAQVLPRTRAIAALLLLEAWTPGRVARAFSGAPGAPQRLRASDRLLVKTLAGQRLAHRDQPSDVALECPEWLLGELEPVFGPGLGRELAALCEPAPLDLRVNTLAVTREQALRSLAREGVRPRPTPFSPVGLRLERAHEVAALEAFRRGWIEVQDEGAQIAALLLEAQPGAQVLDLCAGAGGKTLALAAAMQGRGRLVACDVSAGRSRRAAVRRRRAGAHNVEQRTLTSERDAWLARQKGRFDRVLVDAPCTGIGSWRRNPDGRWRLARRDAAELVALQRRLLRSAARLLRPGGRLLYAVCTWLPRETEAQSGWLLEAEPGLRAVPLDAAWGRSLQGECPLTPQGAVLLTPARHGTDGFFLALFERTPLA
jgi:16S rRNA (cytosine967-C5)-methyltransferase